MGVEAPHVERPPAEWSSPDPAIQASFEAFVLRADNASIGASHNVHDTRFKPAFNPNLKTHV
jgi:hypothetical protein